MSTRERIQKLTKYFRAMNVAPDKSGNFVTYVEVYFPESWVIIETTNLNFGVDYSPSENKGCYYFWSSDSDAENKIFDAIDANVKVNEEAEEKVRFLLGKIEELKELFSNDTMDLETLKTLEFKFSKPKTTKLPSAIQSKKDSQEEKNEVKETSEQ